MTIRSMTGFGRSEGSSGGITFTVEVRSVNHRYLDLKARLPKYLVTLEPRLKSLIKPFAKRGRVDIQVALSSLDSSSDLYRLDLDAAAFHLEKHRSLADALDVQIQCTTSELMKAPGVFTQTSAQSTIELAPEDVVLALENAFSKLHQMRCTEGAHLSQAMMEMLQLAADYRDELSTLAERQTGQQREKLMMRMASLFDEASKDQEARLMLEIGLIAERLDVQEELDRLAAHIEQFQAVCIEETSEPVGRRLDFLCQEMVREVNTIASKAQSIDVTRITIELKTLMERIREQVQNVE